MVNLAFSLGVLYAVIALSIELEFDNKGQWTEVDPENKSVPEAIIPGNIRSYINQSFPKNGVKQISRSSRKYEGELTSGLDLEFDRNGKFLRIDD